MDPISGDFGFNDLAAGWSVLEQMRLDEERRRCEEDDRRRREEDDRRRQELLNQNNSLLSQPYSNLTGLNILGGNQYSSSALQFLYQLDDSRSAISPPELNTNQPLDPTQPNNPYGTIAHTIAADLDIEEAYRRAAKTGKLPYLL